MQKETFKSIVRNYYYLYNRTLATKETFSDVLELAREMLFGFTDAEILKASKDASRDNLEFMPRIPAILFHCKKNRKEEKEHAEKERIARFHFKQWCEDTGSDPDKVDFQKWWANAEGLAK